MDFRSLFSIFLRVPSKFSIWSVKITIHSSNCTCVDEALNIVVQHCETKIAIYYTKRVCDSKVIVYTIHNKSTFLIFWRMWGWRVPPSANPTFVIFRSIKMHRQTIICSYKITVGAPQFVILTRPNLAFTVKFVSSCKHPLMITGKQWSEFFDISRIFYFWVVYIQTIVKFNSCHLRCRLR